MIASADFFRVKILKQNTNTLMVGVSAPQCLASVKNFLSRLWLLIYNSLKFGTKLVSPIIHLLCLA